MTNTPDFAALGDESFVSLTTFRKSGVAVSTPVWIARDGDALVVTTPEESGKVKRLRNSGRVELTPSNHSGKIKPGAIAVPGFASIHGDSATIDRLSPAFLKKYGFQYRILMIIETLVAKRQKARVVLRITATE